MGIVHTQDSAHARELAKWESQPTAQCPSPLRPYVYQEVPTMCYYAERPVGGGEVAWRKERVEEQAMVANLRSRGWGVGQAEAIAELETRETALAVAAAERAHSDRGMSDKARAEADAFDETVADHVGAIPDTPIVRRKHRASNVTIT